MSAPAQERRRTSSGPGSEGPGDRDNDEAALPGEPSAPTEEEWAALTLAQRQRVMDDLVGYEEERAAMDQSMAEGERHLNAKVQVRDMLRHYYQSQRPTTFISADIPVHYPGHKAIRPDAIAVENVPTHPRESWMVSYEGKGIDLALEIHNKGSWRKDFVDNVTKYAALGIREYFIFHLRKGTLQGHQLLPGGGDYVPVPLTQWGRMHSQVLGLDLVAEGGTLRFYAGSAELLESGQLLIKMRDLFEAARQHAQEAEADGANLAASLAASILALLEARSVALDPEEHVRITECRDAAQLTQWATRAAKATQARDIFAPPSLSE